MFKGDATKFDSTVREFAFGLICDVRKRFAPSESHDALDFIYSVLSNKVVVLPSGELVEDSCQPSGQACTTSDNSIFHALVVLYCAARRLRQQSLAVNWENVNNLLTISLYSDDHVGATNDDVFGSYLFRKECYAEMGVLLKEEDDLLVASSEMQQLVFLGGRFAPYGNPAPYVYYFDDPYALENLHLALHGRTPTEALQTITSYAELLAYNPKRYNKLVRLYTAVLKQCPDQLNVPKLHTRFYYLSAQMGLE